MPPPVELGLDGLHRQQCTPKLDHLFAVGRGDHFKLISCDCRFRLPSKSRSQHFSPLESCACKESLGLYACYPVAGVNRMSSSLRRILASRANGARSKGPATLEGKRRSSQNAIRHGLLARCIVLDKESSDSFEALLSQHLDRLQSADGVEFGMVEEMVSSYWRMRRAWAIETRMLEDASSAAPESVSAPETPSDPVGSITAAFISLANSPALALMHRYETRLHLVYQRSLQNLLLMRALAVPNEAKRTQTNSNEPNPIFGHSTPISGELPPA
jgi:hypothetical protein